METIEIQEINNQYHVVTAVEGFVIYTDCICETLAEAEIERNKIIIRENTYNTNQNTNYK
tara:strand:+ start:432 stop:611 length:180 start_codon:yes stop_codon:yes gene_type:complete